MTIRFISFDIDGCLFNYAYLRAHHEDFKKHFGDAVIIHNKALFELLKAQNKDFSKVYAFVGSTRQSMDVDRLNKEWGKTFKGSCCPAFLTVCNYLGINPNTFLLADIFGNLPNGASFDLILRELEHPNWLDSYKKPVYEHASFVADELKRPLLFAQMQEAAAAHPDEPIEFDFIDDSEKILFNLQKFFKENPHMIPQNVTLRLNQYAGDQMTPKSEIKGTGLAYDNYKELVIHMSNNQEDMYHIAKAVKLAYPSQKSKEVSLPKVEFITEFLKHNAVFDTAEEVSKYFRADPSRRIAIRKSSIQAEDDGIYTFTYCKRDSSGLKQTRVGINPEGKLFGVDNDGKLSEPEPDFKQLLLDLLKEQPAPACGIETISQISFLTLFSASNSRKKEETSPIIQSRSPSGNIAQVLEVVNSRLYVKDRAEAEAQLRSNKEKELEFLLRPSNSLYASYYTFSVSFMTVEGITHQRYAINGSGVLIGFNKKEKPFEIDSSEGIIEAVRKQVVLAKDGVVKVTSPDRIELHEFVDSFNPNMSGG